MRRDCIRVLANGVNMGTRLSLNDIYAHLTSNGIMSLYTVWYLHSEVRERQQYMASSSNSGDPCSNPTVAFVQDAFSFRESYDPPAFDTVSQADPVVKENMMSYQRLLDEAMTPLYEGSKVIALCSMLRVL